MMLATFHTTLGIAVLLLIVLPLITPEQLSGEQVGSTTKRRHRQVHKGAVSFVKPQRRRRPSHPELPKASESSAAHRDPKCKNGPYSQWKPSWCKVHYFVHCYSHCIWCSYHDSIRRRQCKPCKEKPIDLDEIPKIGCAASSGDNGTCLTTSECTERGGVASGPCASGYGVCCVFFATCGQNIRENCTYFVNPGYPGPYDGTGSCQLTVNKNHPDVCQFRLDFDQFNVAGPEPVNNMCTSDQFIVSGGNPTPAICGTNNGNHMYVDTGLGTTNPVTLTFVTSGPSFPRNWKVKICQIPCSTIYRAEEGCLQYFTGVAGQIKSYNYDPGSGLQLSNQDYSICVRMERNFCGIQYTSCTDTVNNRTHAFTLSGNTLSRDAIVPSMVSSRGPFPCTNDWISIPCAENVGQRNTSNCVDRICGGTLSAQASMIPTPIFSTIKPFRIVFHTDNVEAPGDVGNRGMCLNYVQQPCTNNL